MKSSPKNQNSIQKNEVMSEKPSDKEKSVQTTPLNAESIKDLWSKTYNTEGKPDWSHILPYYADDIYFRDSIQGLQGMEEFRQ